MYKKMPLVSGALSYVAGVDKTYIRFVTYFGFDLAPCAGPHYDGHGLSVRYVREYFGAGAGSAA